MIALVTGAAGFVGRHLVDRLLHDGYEVIGIDPRIEAQRHWDQVRYSHIQGDCRKWFTHHGVQTKFDLVFHCAAQIGGRVGIEHNPIGVADDIAIDIAFLNWVRKARPASVVYYSSSAAYPVDLQRSDVTARALKESDIRLPEGADMPDMTYGWAKLTGEYLVEFIRPEVADTTNIIVLRPFSGYGEDQDLDYPFPSIMRRVRNREYPLTVWSDAVRDFVHIDDIVELTFKAIAQKVTTPLNICSGQATSFSHLAHAAVLVANELDPAGRYRPEVQVLGAGASNERPAGVFYRVGDPTAMNTVYAPRVSLREGIRRSLRWTG